MSGGPAARLRGPVALVLVAVAALGAHGAGDASGRADPSVMPATSAGTPRSLPRDLVPALDDASSIRPRAYADGCHAKAGDTRARACSYGVADGGYTVLLMGDSHAVQWLPALEAIAVEEGWRLYSLTKSACPVPDIGVIVRGKRLRDCDRWRDSAFERVAEIHPDLVIAASLGTIYELPKGDARRHPDRSWRNAWVASLEELGRHAGMVALLGDTPMWLQDPLVCLRRHRHDIGRCDTPREDAVSERTDALERAAARSAGAAYVPTADLVCVDDPCPAVEGRYLILGDTQHMTVAWARHIAGRLLDRLRCAMPGAMPAASGAPPGATPAASGGPRAHRRARPSPSAGLASMASPGPSTGAGMAPSPSPMATPPVSCPS
ncbi:MAG: SGNH hydrolase domain-containing protein [Chloroflexota bacterium]